MDDKQQRAEKKNKMKLSFKNVTYEILDIIQKVKDLLKDVEITQESDGLSGLKALYLEFYLHLTFF